MRIFVLTDRTKKIGALSVLILMCVFLTYLFQFRLGMDSLFTHFFYIPIFISILWFRGKGFIAITILADTIIISHVILHGVDGLQSNAYRVLMFYVVGYLFYLMNERIMNLIDDIRQNLREKEVLLSEIHHRVKNNLQVITSLIGLQVARAGDEASMELFNETYNRVLSMAMVHEKLYRKENYELINFREYIEDLIRHLANSYNIHRKNIDFRINMENIYLDINIAIPCALIINEIITNSLRHAFKTADDGVIDVAVFRDEFSRLNMTVSDNGAGIPRGIDISRPTSMGLELINILTRQLGGTLELQGVKGTSYIIQFVEQPQRN